VLILFGAGISLVSCLWRTKASLLPILIVFVSLILLLIHRVVPYSRVWLYFAPLYYFAAADGWWLLVKTIGFSKWTNRIPDWVTANAILCLCLVTSINLLRAHPGGVVVGGDSFTASRQVSQHFRDHIDGPYRVLVLRPSAGPMFYYFKRYELSGQLLFALEHRPDTEQLLKGTPCYVVVNTEMRQTLHQVYAMCGIEDVERMVRQSVLVKTFEGAEVWVIQDSGGEETVDGRL
jgi:hypothetical protein